MARTLVVAALVLLAYLFGAALALDAVCHANGWLHKYKWAQQYLTPRTK